MQDIEGTWFSPIEEVKYTMGSYPFSDTINYKIKFSKPILKIYNIHNNLTEA